MNAEAGGAFRTNDTCNVETPQRRFFSYLSRGYLCRACFPGNAQSSPRVMTEGNTVR
jgi:hypothetical protein